MTKEKVQRKKKLDEAIKDDMRRKNIEEELNEEEDSGKIKEESSKAN